MRHEIERRPLLAAFIGLCIGMAAALQPLNALFLLPLPLLRTRVTLGAAIAAVIVGFILAPVPPAHALAEPGIFEGQVLVSSVPEIYGTSHRLIVRSSGSSYYLWTDRPDIGLGDRLAARGEIAPAVGELARSRGIVGSIRANKLTVVERGGWASQLATRWRTSFVEFCDESLASPATSTVAALCFNVREQLDPQFRENLRRTGTIHIISVSGLHVLIFALGLSGLLSMLPIPRLLNLAVLVSVLAVYAMATGLQPPVVRAVVMAAVYYGAYLFRREPDVLSALALAGIAYLLWQPDSLLDMGFQLSFATVATLGLWMRPSELPVEPVPRLVAQLKSLAMVSLVATLGSAPLVAYHFGQVSIISVVANALIALALAPLTLCALAALPLTVFPALALGVMKVVVEPLAGWVMAVVNTLGSLPFAAIQVPLFNAYWLIPIYGLALIMWRKHARQP